MISNRNSQLFPNVAGSSSSHTPLVTIAIPTYNRPHLLKVSLASALSQDYQDIRVMVLDNASSESTRQVAESFTDDRLCYLRSETNIGGVSNWNRAIELNNSPYFVLLQDDDMLLPSFVKESLSRLEQNPDAAFSFAHIRHIDEAGKLGDLKDPYNGPAEVTSGLDFLHMAVSGQGWFIHSSAVMIRASALNQTGGRFDSPHTKNAFDFNLFVRLAARFSVVPVLKELVYVRQHSGQDTETHWRTGSGTGPLGFTAERIDALAYLLGSERAQDPLYRKWLMERLLNLNAQSSAFAHPLLPDLYWNWNERLTIAKREINSIVAPGESFILVDEEQWATGGELAGRKTIPFTSKDGIYWGPPVDDEAAIAGIEQLRREGLMVIIFGWPAFWWLEHYVRFNEYLTASSQLVFKSPRILVFTMNSVSYTM